MIYRCYDTSSLRPNIAIRIDTITNVMTAPRSRMSTG